MTNLNKLKIVLCSFVLISFFQVIVSSLVRNFVPEKSRKSIMLRQTESSFEVLLNRHSYSNAQSASHLNTQADSLLSVLYKNPLRGKCRQQRSAFEFHG